MNPVDVAWLAGIFEGEGWMEIGRNGGTRLGIRMCDRDVIERVHALLPGSSPIAKTEYDNPKHKASYQWRLSGHAKVKEALEVLLPWFGERRSARALEVLAHIAQSIGPGGHMRARTHCPQGHEYNPENTAIKAGTNQYRLCRACMKISWTKNNAKRSAARQVTSG